MGGAPLWLDSLRVARCGRAVYGAWGQDERERGVRCGQNKIIIILLNILFRKFLNFLWGIQINNHFLEKSY